MDQDNTYQIGPRPGYLALVVPMSLLVLLFCVGIYKITVSQTKGALIIIAAALLLYLWRAGYSMILDPEGIHERMFGICFRHIPWDRVAYVICYPDFDMEKIGSDMRILILLSGMKQMVIPSGDPERFHLKHPLKTLYVGFGNYSSIFAKFTPLTYCDDWGKW